MPFKEDAALLKAKLDETKAFWDKIGDADLTAEQKQEIDKLNKEAEELSHKVAESREYQEARTAQEKMRADLSAPLNTPDFPGFDARGGDPNARKTLGHRFVESKQWKEFVSNLAGEAGVIGNSIKFGNSPMIEMDFKSLVTNLSLNRDSGSGMNRPDYQGVVPFFLRPLTLRDVITVGTTNSDMVEFTQITAFDNQAAPTAEPTSVNSSGVATGGLYNQSGMNTSLVKANVKSIPHYVPISKRALMDSPQIQTYIDNFLIQGAEIKLEDQMIIGDNTGENFQGLDNTPGITLQASDSGNDNLKVTRQACTKVRIIGRAVPTAYVMHPTDWEAFDLTKNSQGNYYFGGPLALGLKTLWGIPVVESEAIRTGTFYVGDMKQAVLWDRARANVFATDSPNDYVLRGLVALVCELRAAFGVLRPAAIVRGDLLAGPNS